MGLVLHAPVGRLSCIEQLGCVCSADSSDKPLPNPTPTLRRTATQNERIIQTRPRTIHLTQRRFAMGGRVVCNDPTLQTQLPTYRYPDPATIPYVPLRVSVVFSR
jgi:hypothetical protein